MVQENPTYTINQFVLQECGDITWRVSDTVKNERELITGDDGVCLGESNIYHQLVDFSIMGGFESESRN